MPALHASVVIEIDSDNDNDKSRKIPVIPIDSDSESLPEVNGKQSMPRSKPGPRNDVHNLLKRRREDDEDSVASSSSKKQRFNPLLRGNGSSAVSNSQFKSPISEVDANSTTQMIRRRDNLDILKNQILKKGVTTTTGINVSDKDNVREEHPSRKAVSSPPSDEPTKGKTPGNGTNAKRTSNAINVAIRKNFTGQNWLDNSVRQISTNPNSGDELPGDFPRRRARTLLPANHSESSSTRIIAANGVKGHDNSKVDSRPQRVAGVDRQTARVNFPDGPNVERAKNRDSNVPLPRVGESENLKSLVNSSRGSNKMRNRAGSSDYALDLAAQIAREVENSTQGSEASYAPSRLPEDSNDDTSKDGECSTTVTSHEADSENIDTTDQSGEKPCATRPILTGFLMHTVTGGDRTSQCSSLARSERDGSATAKGTCFDEPSNETSASRSSDKANKLPKSSDKVQAEVRAMVGSDKISGSAASPDKHDGEKRNPVAAKARLVSQTASQSREVRSEQAQISDPLRNIPTKARARILDPVFSKMSNSERIQKIVSDGLEESRGDTDYWARTWFQRSRTPLRQNAVTSTSASKSIPTSIFSTMKAKHVFHSETEKTSNDIVDLKLDCLRLNTKVAKKSWMIHPKCVGKEFKDLPNYNHYVRVNSNLLAANDKVLHHWPYISEDPPEGIESRFHEQYFIDKEDRQRKLRRLLQAEAIAEYVEDILFNIDCSWSDVLQFFLSPGPDVGSDPDSAKALSARETYCDEDFARNSSRWEMVHSKLPAAEPAKLGRVALLCQFFQRLTNFSLWHLARRCDHVKQLLFPVSPELLPDLTCRVCLRFSCPYHGEISERDDKPYGHDYVDADALSKDLLDGKDESPASDEIVQTDIINPPRINFRRAVPFPPTETEHAHSSSKTYSAHYWQTEFPNHLPENRGPFYPCNHPGVTCKTAACSCFRDKVPCEKSCACPSNCQRKYHGCSCYPEKMRKGQKLVCYQDDRCLCFALGRECDPDLCGSCGVSEVLDPVHRHEAKRPGTVCNNASLGRAIRKHTVLGDSAVHGFGLYACEPIQEHEYVDEYIGELISLNEGERRGAVYEYQKLSYLFSLNKAQDIDGTRFGNKSRFINHASKGRANLYARIQLVNMVYRVGLYATRAIGKGEELFFEYGDKFPDLQLDAAGAENVANPTPHVRNTRLVQDEFYDVEFQTLDEHGTRRARKVTGKTASRGGATTTTSTNNPSFLNPTSDSTTIPRIQSRRAKSRPRTQTKTSSRATSIRAPSTRAPSPSDDDDDNDGEIRAENFDPAERLENYYVSRDSNDEEDVEMNVEVEALAVAEEEDDDDVGEDDEFRPDEEDDDSSSAQEGNGNLGRRYDDEEEEEEEEEDDDDNDEDEGPISRYPFKRAKARGFRK